MIWIHFEKPVYRSKGAETERSSKYGPFRKFKMSEKTLLVMSLGCNAWFEIAQFDNNSWRVENSSWNEMVINADS